jgi:CHAT domain-containing protein/TPR repeat protein
MTSGKNWRKVGLAIAGVGVFCIAFPTRLVLHLWRKPSPELSVVRFVRDSNHSIDPELLLDEANRLAWLSNWPKAGPLYQSAEQLFRERGDRRNEIFARIGRIRSQSETSSPVEVSEMLAQQLTDPVVQTDPKLRLWCLASTGSAELDVNVPSAKRTWTEAQKIAKKLGEHAWEARAKAELGIISFLEGDSRRAGQMVGGALIFAMASGDIGGQVRDLEMLGNGFNEAKRYAEALAFFDRAIKLAKKTPDAGFPLAAYEGKAQALTFQGKAVQANDLLKEALVIARNEGWLGHEARILVVLGEVAIQTGNREQAKKYLEQAGTLGQNNRFYYPVSRAMFALTKMYRDSGDLKAAEAHASVGVEASRHLESRYYLPRDLTVLADLKALRGDVLSANRLYEQAEGVIEGMLNNASGPYWSSSLAGEMSETYLHHFELCVRTGKMERALAVLEHVRGRTAAALLANGVSFTGKETQEAQVLEATVSQLQAHLMSAPDPDEHAKLSEQLIEYERRLEWSRRDQAVSRYVRFETPVSIRGIQAILRSDELLLEYVLDEPQAYCIWISRVDAGIEKLPAGRQRIEEWIKDYLAEIQRMHDAVDIAKKLSHVLLEPVTRVATSTKLIVVPDGLLHLLPIDTLRDSRGNPLVESKTVSYVPASTVLYVLRNRKVFGAKRTFLGVGDVAYQNQGGVSAKLGSPRGIQGTVLRQFSNIFGTPLYDLPQTRQELTEINKIVGNDSDLLLGPGATETAFKSQPLAEFKIVHLAVHAFADSEFPERSGLVLGVDPLSSDDGLLQIREIVRLRFSADLVTLSACNTGIGKLLGEEGMTNLPEAFLMGGAKSVVASLWSADDNYTLVLMEQFYRHIAAGEILSEALRQAKLDMLSKYGERTPPYYWGGFVLVGDGGYPIALSHQ